MHASNYLSKICRPNNNVVPDCLVNGKSNEIALRQKIHDMQFGAFSFLCIGSVSETIVNK